MRLLTGIAVLVLMVACTTLGVASMPTITVTNQSDSMVQITPLDDVHKPPATLDQIGGTLPPGSFILTNQTATPINVIVTLWSYIDRNGNTQERRFNCDGYITGLPENMVGAKDSVLITPGGCTKREYFAHQAAGKPMLGGSLFLSINKPISEVADTLGAVRITVDSVIFENGKIWGPDTQRYYKIISARYWAIRSVVEEVSTARAAGQDMKIPLERMLAEPSAGTGETSGLRKSFARKIHDSPNPEGTLKFYSQHPPLPEFQHIGGQMQ